MENFEINTTPLEELANMTLYSFGHFMHFLGKNLFTKLILPSPMKIEGWKN